MLGLKIIAGVIACLVTFSLLRMVPDLVRYLRICWL